MFIISVTELSWRMHLLTNPKCQFSCYNVSDISSVQTQSDRLKVIDWQICHVSTAWSTDAHGSSELRL